MKIQSEQNLRSFSFWAGAADHVKYLTWGQLDELEEILEDIYPDGLDDTTLNDIMWFDEDIVAEWLGFESFEELMEDSIPWDE
jgi:hypothetical protein